MQDQQVGPYQLVRRIAVGGMAEVHLAKTVGVAGFEKLVALKMIHPALAENQDFVTMLVDEANIAVQLSHPNIAQTFDLGRDGDTYYLAMEYIDGIDLFNLIRASQYVGFMLPFDACAFVAREVANALEHAHGKRDGRGELLGVIHRDIAPDNILISHEGAVKLVDFGIAKATARGSHTAIGVVKGKFGYMSPEQTFGEPVDATTDIYAAGVVLYEMLTGRPLYTEINVQRLLELIREGSFVAPSRLRGDVPPALERIVMRCLAPRAHRYRSSRELAADLHHFLQAYSPQFVTATLGSLMNVVLDRAGYKRPSNEPDAGDARAFRAITQPEPSWSTAHTNPFNKRQTTNPYGLVGPKMKLTFDQQFEDRFESIKLHDDNAT